MSSLDCAVDRKGFFREVSLDDGYAHVLIEYDRESVPLTELREAIESTGTRVIETRDLPGGLEKSRVVLFRLDVEDVREVILSLSKYPLIHVTGYNSKK